MIESSPATYFYKLGGALEVDAPSYVQRHADEDFYQGLKAGEFCYVLNARQMGKSSLQARTRQRLEAEGIRCVIVDITAIGTTESTMVEWYAGMIDSLVGSFELYDEFDLEEWWESLPLLSPVQRFSKFLESVLLQAVPEPIVVFIDEIDSVRSLPFNADDFFAVIRSVYNQRSTQPEYRRLTFALIGAATPIDLIRDMQRTPFNIGRAIELVGFQLHEAEPLRRGLGKLQDTLPEILAWTGGQPFLTQKLCALVRKAIKQQATPIDNCTDWIAQIVQQGIVENWEGKDDPVHLRTIRGRLLEVGEAEAGRLLGLYQQVLEQEDGLPGDDSLEQMKLRLSGLVVKQNGRLQVYNWIYRQVFDLAWVQAELAKLRPAYYQVAIAEWLAAEKQDESLLLRGRTLQDARDWAKGKSLAEDDRRFLEASLALEGRETQRKLQAEAEANQILTVARQQAERELAIAHQQLKVVNRKVKIGGVVLAVSLGLAGVVGVGAILATGQKMDAEKKAAEANQRNQIEEQSRAALRQFDSNQTESLFTAMEAGQSLQKLVGRRSQEKDAILVGQKLSLMQYPTFTPLMALQQILSQIQERQIPVLHARINSLDWTADGKVLAVGGADNQIRLLNSHGVPIRDIEANQEKVNSLRWTSDGQILATGGSDGTVKLWKPDGTLLLNLQTHQGNVQKIEWTPDGTLLTTIGDNDTIKLWNLAGVLVKEIQADQEKVNDIAWTPDGRILATSGDNGTVKLWGRTGVLIKSIQVTFDRISSMTWTPDGQTLATGGHNRIMLWNQNGSLIKEFQTNQDWVRSMNWTSDSQLLATSGEDGSTKLWKPDGTLDHDIKASQGTIWTIAWSPNNAILAIGGQDGDVKLWNRTNKYNRKIQANQGDYYSLAWTSDNQTLASGGNDGTFKLWRSDGTPITTIQTNQGRIWSLSWTPDGQILATGGDNGNAKLWSRDGTLLVEIPANQGWSLSLDWSSNGQTLATTGGTSNSVKLWHRDGRQIGEIKTNQQIIRNVRWVGSEPLLSTGAEDGTVKLWKTDGTLIQNIQAFDVKVWSMDWSPEGEILAVGADNGRIKLLKRDGTPITEIQAHQSIVWTMRWTTDGQILATSGNDGMIRLWSQNGTPITEIQTNQGAVYGIRWSSDGSILASGGHNGTIHLWAIEDLDTLLAKGCNWLDSYLATSPQALAKLPICQSRIPDPDTREN